MRSHITQSPRSVQQKGPGNITHRAFVAVTLDSLITVKYMKRLSQPTHCSRLQSPRCPNLPTAPVSSPHAVPTYPLLPSSVPTLSLFPLQVILCDCGAQSVAPDGATAQQRGAVHVSTAVVDLHPSFSPKQRLVVSCGGKKKQTLHVPVITPALDHQ